MTTSKAPVKKRQMTAVRKWKIVKNAAKEVDVGMDDTVGQLIGKLETQALNEIAGD